MNKSVQLVLLLLLGAAVVVIIITVFVTWREYIGNSRSKMQDPVFSALTIYRLCSASERGLTFF
jgi:hypothetical protein